MVSVILRILGTEYSLPLNKENTFVDNSPQMCCKLGLPPLLTKSLKKNILNFVIKLLSQTAERKSFLSAVFFYIRHLFPYFQI